MVSRASCTTPDSYMLVKLGQSVGEGQYAQLVPPMYQRHRALTVTRDVDTSASYGDGLWCRHGEASWSCICMERWEAGERRRVMKEEARRWKRGVGVVPHWAL